MPIRSSDPQIPRALVATPRHDSSGLVFTMALLAATLLHLGVITLVSFGPPRPEASGIAESALEILILRDAGRGAAAPDAAPSRIDRSGASSSGNAVYDDEIATISDDIEAPEPPMPILDTRTEALEESPAEASAGAAPETDTSADREATLAESSPSPLDAGTVEPSREPVDAEAMSPASTESVEPSPRDLATVARLEPPPEPVPDAEPEPLPPPDPMAARDMSAREAPVDAAAILASRGEEINRLTANLQAKTAAYASRVRRKSVSASTREFRYASYLGAWARKVERIGNLNYPQAARDQRMFGSLILHVAVRSDGSVEQIRVVRSSGYDLLDEAAVRIVELAAPYAPFPPDIAAETDVLDIVRTWQFLRGGGLGWEQ
ncbi:energy transducer TonB [Thiocapsa marina]|uniref:TonB family protein n=1 Tax=Thiocapsa marina 5811 TaxID=768671 RepID=F9UDT4_9GAMM|nr:energy transducer TonB [Thiocapsa marina]EGV17491.1 TonB family protein [Thiocapsa marina 5811]